LIAGQRFVEPALLLEVVPPVDVGLGVVGIDPQRLLVAGVGVSPLGLFGQCHPEVVVRLRRLRPQAHPLVQENDRLAEPAQLRSFHHWRYRLPNQSLLRIHLENRRFLR
jgi:hypothetical protein